MRRSFTLPLVAAAVLSMLVASAPAASAGDWTAWTTDGGGALRYIDYGPGQDGGGDNDDYFRVWDRHADKHGVKAWVWIDGVLKGSKYNGNGAGTQVLWDPVQITGGHTIGMKVCLVDGTNDPTPFACGATEHFEID
jgi:hypothetical protein